MTLSIVAILAALLITGLPIFLALTSTLLVYLGFATDIPLTILPQRMFAGIDNFTLTAIPFFNLAAEIMRAGRLADRLIGLARVCTGFLPGGLGIAAVLACMMFACISGSRLPDSAGPDRSCSAFTTATFSGPTTIPAGVVAAFVASVPLQPAIAVRATSAVAVASSG